MEQRPEKKRQASPGAQPEIGLGAPQTSNVEELGEAGRRNQRLVPGRHSHVPASPYGEPVTLGGSLHDENHRATPESHPDHPSTTLSLPKPTDPEGQEAHCESYYADPPNCRGGTDDRSWDPIEEGVEMERTPHAIQAGVHNQR